ncbi:MAG: SiaB family protein kinase [Bacteroidales bacterium]|nr:SiaB family protein kinase [Bacteroidales bacterium]
MVFKEGYDPENVVAYKGPLTVGLLSYLGNYLKSVIKAEHSLEKKIFRIFIELTQNVSYYSAETATIDNGVSSGVGWFTVKKSNNHFVITTGNLIIKSDGLKLINNCDEINSMNEAALRDLKRKTRSQAMERDVGAHIGLIQTSLLSKSKLNYKVTGLDDKYSYFTISVDIKD